MKIFGVVKGRCIKCGHENRFDSFVHIISLSVNFDKKMETKHLLSDITFCINCNNFLSLKIGFLEDSNRKKLDDLEIVSKNVKLSKEVKIKNLK